MLVVFTVVDTVCGGISGVVCVFVCVEMRSRSAKRYYYGIRIWRRSVDFGEM